MRYAWPPARKKQKISSIPSPEIEFNFLLFVKLNEFCGARC